MTAPSTQQLPSVEQSTLAMSPPTPHPCLNCGAFLQGHFCSTCGQRDIPAYPTVRELAHDAVTELWGWDGRLVSTVRALILRPGHLTREFLEGRRARYIAPIRLYLVTSIAYFLLAAAAPDVKLESGKTLYLGLRVGVPSTDTSRAGDPNPGGERPLTAAERQQLLDEVEDAPALVRPFLRKAIDDPDGLRRGVFETMPRIFFALLPLFALIVSTFYRGRRFPEHLYVAIHLHAFVFLVLALTELTKYTGMAMLVIAAGSVALTSIPVYATLAFRRVYGSSIPATLLKGAGIGAIYVVMAFAAFTATLLWVSTRS